MYLYKYSGPVNQFGKEITSKWSGYTYAVSEAKARSNLSFQFKKQFGLAYTAKISLPGRIELEVQDNSGPNKQISIAEYLKSIGKDTSGLVKCAR